MSKKVLAISTSMRNNSNSEILADYFLAGAKESGHQVEKVNLKGKALFALDYQFRDIYMLTTAAENEASVPEKAVNGLKGWIDCFEKAQLTGTVFAGGVNHTGEIAEHHALKDVYNMGKKI